MLMLGIFKKNHPYFGISMMVFSQVLLVTGWSIVKILSKNINPSELVFFRAAVGLLFLTAINMKSGRPFPRLNDKARMLKRSIYGTLGMFTYFYVLKYMSIGDAATLLNTLPIFVALFAPMFLKEKRARYSILLITLSFAFVLLLLKPGLKIFGVVSIIALFSSLVSSFAMIEIRRLRNTDSPQAITYYFTLFLTIISIIPALLDFTFPTPIEWVGLLLGGVSLSIYQLMMSTAYRYGQASLIAPFSYLGVIFSFLSDIVLFGNTPDILSLIGSAGIIACGIGIMLTSKETSQDKSIPDIKS